VIERVMFVPHGEEALLRRLEPWGHRRACILRDAAKAPLLRMRSKTLMVRSAAQPRVSNHEAMRYSMIA
jgi:hypothetical protein